MKKSIKVLALAVAAMSLTVACNNTPAEVAEDTTVEDTMIEEPVEDSILEEEAVIEETPAPAKKNNAAAKKAEAEKKEALGEQVNGMATQGAAIGKKKAEKALGVQVEQKDGTVIVTTPGSQTTVSENGVATRKKKNN